MNNHKDQTNTAFKMQSHGRDGTHDGTPNKPNLQPMKPRLLDAKDAASYLGISETRVREFVKYGKLRTVALPHPFKVARDTRKILIELSELDAFIERYKAG